ncbi:MAG: outer spore coat protein CotE [Bacilli bacterium]|jgi:spore coat protein E|nr:outer spore coat protein CotE [Bacillota bacterium]HOA77888.1 outer spore coat protein CotE [Bacilli bacterium]HPZ27572.1 outer spore coat protein CotE [Bacilli bacterium]HQC88878.1 outer spore coat protein CotE [Bacilli bacterium]
MNEIREIVTKAIVGKGKKIIRIKDSVTPKNEAFSILGCWIINHEFEATLIDNKVEVAGNFEANIWYSYDENTKTDIAKKIIGYSEVIKTRQIVKEVSSDSRDVIVRILQQPTCTNAKITDSGLELEIVFEVVAEVIGETKMMVTVFTSVDSVETLEDDFENEIDENFMNVN